MAKSMNTEINQAPAGTRRRTGRFGSNGAFLPPPSVARAAAANRYPIDQDEDNGEDFPFVLSRPDAMGDKTPPTDSSRVPLSFPAPRRSRWRGVLVHPTSDDEAEARGESEEGPASQAAASNSSNSRTFRPLSSPQQQQQQQQQPEPMDAKSTTERTTRNRQEDEDLQEAQQQDCSNNDPCPVTPMSQQRRSPFRLAKRYRPDDYQHILEELQQQVETTLQADSFDVIVPLPHHPHPCVQYHSPMRAAAAAAEHGQRRLQQLNEALQQALYSSATVGEASRQVPSDLVPNQVYMPDIF